MFFSWRMQVLISYTSRVIPSYLVMVVHFAFSLCILLWVVYSGDLRRKHFSFLVFWLFICKVQKGKLIFCWLEFVLKCWNGKLALRGNKWTKQCVGHLSEMVRIEDNKINDLGIKSCSFTASFNSSSSFYKYECNNRLILIEQFA